MQVSCQFALTLFGAATLIASTGCARSVEQRETSRIKIAGGNTVTSGSGGALGKSVVAFAYNSDFHDGTLNAKSAFCSGVIIAPDAILTAAHCAEAPDKKMYYAVFATSMKEALKNPASSVRQITKAVKHPGYPDRMVVESWGEVVRNDFIKSPDTWLKDNPNTAPHDIAIVKFEGGLPEGFTPAELVAAEDAAPTEITIAGYGITSKTLFDDGGLLRAVSGVRVHSENDDSRGRNWIVAGDTVPVDLLDKGSEAPRGACPGDSGGPAFTGEGENLRVTGVMSLGELERLSETSSWGFCMGRPVGSEPKPGNYLTDVKPYLGWIKETLQTP